MQDNGSGELYVSPSHRRPVQLQAVLPQSYRPRRVPFGWGLRLAISQYLGGLLEHADKHGSRVLCTGVPAGGSHIFRSNRRAFSMTGVVVQGTPTMCIRFQTLLVVSPSPIILGPNYSGDLPRIQCRTGFPAKSSIVLCVCALGWMNCRVMQVVRRYIRIHRQERSN